MNLDWLVGHKVILHDGDSIVIEYNNCELNHEALVKELLDKGLDKGVCPDCGQILLKNITPTYVTRAEAEAYVNSRLRPDIVQPLGDEESDD